MNFRKILIAVDDNDYSMKAAKAGFELAHLLKATIGMLYVVNTSKEIINADIGITPEQSKTVLLEEAENTINQYIETYGDIENVLKFTPEGIPEKVIINIAEEWEADLIVLGTHSKSGFEKLLKGSTTEYVIKHARVPVMLATQDTR